MSSTSAVDTSIQAMSPDCLVLVSVTTACWREDGHTYLIVDVEILRERIPSGQVIRHQGSIVRRCVKGRGHLCRWRSTWEFSERLVPGEEISPDIDRIQDRDREDGEL